MEITPPSGSILDGHQHAITNKIGRFGELAGEMENPRVFLEKIAALEIERTKLMGELTNLEADQQATEVFRAIGEKDVRQMLAGLAGHLEQVDREALKEMIGGMLEKIELCPTKESARLHYKLAAGEFLASPRGFYG